MKARLILFTTGLAIALLALSACGPAAETPGSEEPAAQPQAAAEQPTESVSEPEDQLVCDSAKWTVMVYLAADNDLGKGDPNMGSQLFQAIQAVAFDPVVQRTLNIVVLYDQYGVENTAVWAKSCRDTGPFTEQEAYWQEGQIHEVNTGSHQTLASFVSWVRTAYPADQFFLSVVSHGYGITPEDLASTATSRTHVLAAPMLATHWGHGGTGLSFDYNDENGTLEPSELGYLSTKELSWALADQHVDVLFLHACLMSMMEVVYEVGTQADYIVAGENYLFGPGQYDQYLHQMANDAKSGATPATIARNWADDYFRSMAQDQPPVPLVLSVIETSKLFDLQKTWLDLSTALIDAQSSLGANEWLARMSQASVLTQHYEANYDMEINTDDGYVDAGDLAAAFKDVFADIPAVHDSAERAMGAIRAAVDSPMIASGVYTNPVTGAAYAWDLEKSLGLSVFFPVEEDLFVGEQCSAGASNAGCFSVTANYTATNFSFTGDTRWDEVVGYLGQNPKSQRYLVDVRSGMLYHPPSGMLYHPPSDCPDNAPTLTIWADDTRATVLNDLKPKVLAETGVCLGIQLVGFGDIRSRMSLFGPAAEGPDIFVGAHEWLGELVTNGIVAPMNLGAKVADFEPVALEAFTYEGQLYGLPYAVENVAFVCNPDLVPQPPTTWTEVQQMSQEAKYAGDLTQFFAIMASDPYHHEPINTAFGGYIFGQTQTGYDACDVGMDSDGAVAYLTWIDTMVKDGLLSADIDWDTAHVLFETGKAACMITGPWALERFDNAGVNYTINVFPGETQDSSPFVGVQGFMINAFSPNRVLAQSFLTDYIATTHVMEALYKAGNRPPAYIPAQETMDDNAEAFAAIVPSAHPMPAIPAMNAVWDAWGTAITTVFQQSATPAVAAATAAKQVRVAAGCD